MKKKSVIIISSIILIIIAIIFIINSKKDKKQELPSIKVEDVKKQRVVTSIESEGTIILKDKISVYSESSGKISSVDIKEGDLINKGNPIATYDLKTKENLEKQLKEANLSLKSAKLSLDALYIPVDNSQILQLETQILQSEKAIQNTQNNINVLNDKLSTAEKDFLNAKVLFEQGAISQSELNNLEENIKNLKNQLESTKSSLEISKKQLTANKEQLSSAKNKSNEPINKNRIESQKVLIEQAKLRVSELEKELNKFKPSILSPQDATVTKLFISEGETITEGKLVAEMGDLNSKIIETFIPEYDMQGIKEGQKVQIKSEASLNEYEGIITKVYPIAEKRNIAGVEKNVVKVEISLPQNSDLKVGFTVKLKIITNIEEDATVIPIMAYMTQANASPYVYIVDAEGTLQKREIKIKSFQGSIVSVEGLKEGETIVSSPSDKIKEGIKIIPIKEDLSNNNVK